MGHDFGDVRVHTNDDAAAGRAPCRPSAYTVGRDIVFGAGQYAPTTSDGKRLLAHELTHVVQQRGGPTPAVQRKLAVGSTEDQGPWPMPGFLSWVPTAAKLQPGDHAWSWKAETSAARNIPRSTWFHGSSRTDASDYQGHGKEIYNYVIHTDHVRRGQPQMRAGPGTFAWMNNNPGNLTAGGPPVGEYAGKTNSTEGLPSFLIFPTEEEGMKGIVRFLTAPPNAYLNLSISATFLRYCPPSGGDPVRYAQSVVEAFKGQITLNTKISELTADQLKRVAEAIRVVEGSIAGESLKRDDPTIPQAIRDQL